VSAFALPQPIIIPSTAFPNLLQPVIPGRLSGVLHANYLRFIEYFDGLGINVPKPFHDRPEVIEVRKYMPRYSIYALERLCIRW
jgi:hypothetical protein